MSRFGEKKHDAKYEHREYMDLKDKKWNPAKATGIFSFNTFEVYKKESANFVKWIRNKYPEIKKIDDITNNQIGEYLKAQDTLKNPDKPDGFHYSPFSISTKMASINKLLNRDIQKKDFNLRGRSYKKITKGRTEKAHHKEVNLDKYSNQIKIAKGTGLRRESMLNLKPKDFIKDSKGIVIKVKLTEKGGRTRESSVLNEYKNFITNFIKEKDNDKKLFTEYPNRINNHKYRREYAQKIYKEINQEYKNKGIIVKNDYRGFNKEIILKVSENLGHSRPSVVVENYL